MKRLGLKMTNTHCFMRIPATSAILLDQENIIIDINQNSARLLKYAPIELLNQKAQVIFENSILPEKLNKASNAESIAASTPTPIFDRDGNKIPIFYKIVPLEREAAGRKLLILVDASIQIEAEYKIQQYENKAALG